MFHTQDDPVTFGVSVVGYQIRGILIKPTVLEIHLWTSNNELYWTYDWNTYDCNSLLKSIQWNSSMRFFTKEIMNIGSTREPSVCLIFFSKAYKEKSYTSDSPIRLAKFPTNFWEFLQKVSHLTFPKFVPNETKKKFSEKSLRSFDKPTDKQTVDME